MSCCTRCKPIHFGFRKATTSVDGNKLLITINDFCPDLIIQGDSLNFAICSCITYPQTKINGVEVVVNGTSFTGIKFGDVYWDQIKNRTQYHIVFGTAEPTATFLDALPCSKYDYPTYSTTSTTTEETEAE